jgi:hypothetical protein
MRMISSALPVCQSYVGEQATPVITYDAQVSLKPWHGWLKEAEVPRGTAPVARQCSGTTSVPAYCAALTAQHYRLLSPRNAHGADQGTSLPRYLFFEMPSVPTGSFFGTKRAWRPKKSGFPIEQRAVLREFAAGTLHKDGLAGGLLSSLHPEPEPESEPYMCARPVV